MNRDHAAKITRKYDLADSNEAEPQMQTNW